MSTTSCPSSNVGRARLFAYLAGTDDNDVHCRPLIQDVLLECRQEFLAQAHQDEYGQ